MWNQLFASALPVHQSCANRLSKMKSNTLSSSCCTHSAVSVCSSYVGWCRQVTAAMLTRQSQTLWCSISICSLMLLYVLYDACHHSWALTGRVVCEHERKLHSARHLWPSIGSNTGLSLPLCPFNGHTVCSTPTALENKKLPKLTQSSSHKWNVFRIVIIILCESRLGAGLRTNGTPV